MRLLTKKENKIVFGANTGETLANSIRRSVNSTPIIAIESVEISKNDSPLYDETIAHRLGLVPLKMDKTMKETEEKKLKLRTNKKGFVYSKELKGDVDVVYGNIPITLLNKDQEMNLKAIVKVGKGNEHSKFSPGLIYYRNACEITLDKEFLSDIKGKFSENRIKEKGNKIIVEDNLEKPTIDFCEGLAVKDKKKAEVKDTGELIISIESFGQISVENIFKKSIDILRKKLNEVAKKI